jgi:hypothetical protein
MTDPDYDQGFRDGVKFVTKHIRLAADQVEKTTRQTFEAKGKTYHAIARLGQPIYAAKLRELAAELERIVTQ